MFSAIAAIKGESVEPRIDTGVELVTNGSNFIRGYDPATGEERWRLDGSSQITAPTPVCEEGVIVVVNGRRPERPIFVIRPGAEGDITLAENDTPGAFNAAGPAYTRAGFLWAIRGSFGGELTIHWPSPDLAEELEPGADRASDEVLADAYPADGARVIVLADQEVVDPVELLVRPALDLDEVGRAAVVPLLRHVLHVRDLVEQVEHESPEGVVVFGREGEAQLLVQPFEIGPSVAEVDAFADLQDFLGLVVELVLDLVDEDPVVLDLAVGGRAGEVVAVGVTDKQHVNRLQIKALHVRKNGGDGLG